MQPGERSFWRLALAGYRPVLLFGPVAMAPSCSLMVDADAVSRAGATAGAAAEPGGESGAPATRSCRVDEKVCEVDGERGCFPVDDPDLGCAEDGCEPCDLAHAVATCAFMGPCQIDECIDSFRNCDGEAENGCEVDVRKSVEHCGRCDRPCDGTCRNGSCEVGAGGAGP